MAKYVVRRRLIRKGLFLCGREAMRKIVPRRMKRLHCPSRFRIIQMAVRTEYMQALEFVVIGTALSEDHKRS